MRPGRAYDRRARKEKHPDHHTFDGVQTMSMFPLSVVISTRDNVDGRDVQQQYMVRTTHPRWELMKIFVHALFHLRFR
jgi:transketolase C-terminal domain/subunit